MKKPIKRYKAELVNSAVINGKTISQGILVPFRDNESLELAATAIATKYGYYSKQEIIDGVADRTHKNIDKMQFLELAIEKFLNDAIIEYRRANAETASVNAELPELPDTQRGN